MEIWDAYDKNGELIGIDLIRGEKIPDGQYHKVCHAIIRHVDGDYLLMQRAYTKPMFPGEWEIGAAGCVAKGEEPRESIIREVTEETGILEGGLTHIHHTIIESSHSIHDTFLWTTNWEKDKIKLQEGETIAYKWISKEELIAHFDKGEALSEEVVRMKEYIDSIR